MRYYELNPNDTNKLFGDSDIIRRFGLELYKRHA